MLRFFPIMFKRARILDHLPKNDFFCKQCGTFLSEICMTEALINYTLDRQ
jgi:hypothetical protein